MAETLTKHEIDVEYVKQKLAAMQRQKAWGAVTVQFERGVIQKIDVNLHYMPPSNKNFEAEGLENF